MTDAVITDDANPARRRFLAVATTVTGGVGAAFALTPFLASFKPSARAQALGAPVEIDISKVEPGGLLKVEWRGKPVWVLRRTQDMLARLQEDVGELRDPESAEAQQPQYAQNDHRSIKPEFLVVVGSCTHLGCSPMERFELGPADLGADWKGGFYCPCHGSKFDLAGRVWKGVPAPLNLTVPPHRYVSEGTLVIGNDTGNA
jgi:ubiquinol-cytochrome c reductase iron-sulfur subunit